MNIKIGDYVMYINTGTKGKVVDIVEDYDGLWVVLDNGLMYRPHLLKVIDEKDVKKEEKKKIEIEEEEDIWEDKDYGDACGAG
ncbi:hypothetical protein J422_00125 [Methanocaldococcus villosus KIN24-T80]|uniref:DUF2098 domain-containing protein n=1 Tax=Methanocaldococcus villosus KIN24-T80 TaxID=1069083 RepID=N6V3G9_9EURY|nr:DUF2098 family protein [Methanocaldococcus villosus]ENN96808.1 hypothetical protein J422_00125 [Methanocaldococcus villosus KIN24-T80]